MDLTQATCVRAIEKASGYQPGTRLDSWLFKMEQRLWLNELRARSVRTGGGLQPVEYIDIPDPGPDAEMNFFIRQVFSSMNQLPEAQRATVLLVYVEGIRYAEAARILDVPIGTVMSRLAVARKTVSGCMNTQKEGIRRRL